MITPKLTGKFRYSPDPSGPKKVQVEVQGVLPDPDYTGTVLSTWWRDATPEEVAQGKLMGAV